MSKITYQPWTPAHAKRYADAQAFDAPQCLAQFFKEGPGKGDQVLLACDGARIVGYISFGVRGDHTEIGLLNVAWNWRRRGIGRALLDAALEASKGTRCWKALCTPWSTRFWEANGFTRDWSPQRAMWNDPTGPQPYVKFPTV